MRIAVVAALVVLPFTAQRAGAQGCDSTFYVKQGSTVVMSRATNNAAVQMGDVESHVDSSVITPQAMNAWVTITSYMPPRAPAVSHVLYHCDGSTTTITYLGTDGMQAFLDSLSRDAETKGVHNVRMFSYTEPQVWPVSMHVGDTLPSYRAARTIVKGQTEFTVTQVKQVGWQKPDTVSYPGAEMATIFHKSILDTEQKLIGMGFVTGFDLAMDNIHVAAKETCSTPAGDRECYRIEREVRNIMWANEADQKQKWDNRAKAPAMKQTDWYAPGIGVVKMTMTGGPVQVTMQTKAIK